MWVDTESIIIEKNKITIDDDETDPMVKSLCSERVQLMVSLMIENALQKLVSHFKEQISRNWNNYQHKLKTNQQIRWACFFIKIQPRRYPD